MRLWENKLQCLNPKKCNEPSLMSQSKVGSTVMVFSKICRLKARDKILSMTNTLAYFRFFKHAVSVNQNLLLYNAKLGCLPSVFTTVKYIKIRPESNRGVHQTIPPYGWVH